MSSVPVYYGDKTTSVNLEQSTFEIHDKIAVVSFTNHKKLYAMSIQLIWEILLLMEHFERDVNIGIVIWKGGDKGFCSGADFMSLETSVPSEICEAYNVAGKGLMPSSEGTMDIALKGLVKRLLTFNKISLCFVKGIAVGGGANFALLLHDFCFATKDAKFKLPFSALGITPELASSRLYQLYYGSQSAKRILWLNKWMPATELSSQYHLIDIVDDISMVFDFIKDNNLLENLPFLLKSKKLINSNIINEELDDCLDRENIAINEGIASPEFGERLANALKPKSKL